MIEGVGDFLKIVNELYPENGEAFFRGQPSSEFDVSSSLCRFISECNGESDNIFAPKFSNELFNKFEEKFPAYPESALLKSYSINKIDTLMSAQHYGMPTRLIDWSRNPLIALYFATENVSMSVKYFSVFILKETKGSKLKLNSSKTIIDGMLRDKNAIFDTYNRLIYHERLFLEYLDSNQYDISKCEKMIVRTHSEIRESFLSDNLGIDSKNIFDMHDGEDGNFYKVISSVVRDVVILQFDFTENPDPDFYKKTIREIRRKLEKGISNHVISPIVSELYGNDHVLIEPLPINNRIKNQQGVFLFSKKNECPEFEKEYFEIGKNVIRSKSNVNNEIKRIGIIRIDINSRFLESIRKELSRYGLSKSFIYPELPSYTEEIKNSFLSMYKNN